MLLSHVMLLLRRRLWSWRRRRLLLGIAIIGWWLSQGSLRWGRGWYGDSSQRGKRIATRISAAITRRFTHPVKINFCRPKNLDYNSYFLPGIHEVRSVISNFDIQSLAIVRTLQSVALWHQCGTISCQLSQVFLLGLFSSPFVGSLTVRIHSIPQSCHMLRYLTKTCSRIPLEREREKKNLKGI